MQNQEFPELSASALSEGIGSFKSGEVSSVKASAATRDKANSSRW